MSNLALKEIQGLTQGVAQSSASLLRSFGPFVTGAFSSERKLTPGLPAAPLQFAATRLRFACDRRRIHPPVSRAPCRTHAVAREHGNAIFLFLPLSASYALAGLLAIGLPDRCEGSEPVPAGGKATAAPAVGVAPAEGESEDAVALTAHDACAKAEPEEGAD